MMMVVFWCAMERSLLTSKKKSLNQALMKINNKSVKREGNQLDNCGHFYMQIEL
jgi:hypothetical protein